MTQQAQLYVTKVLVLLSRQPLGATLEVLLRSLLVASTGQVSYPCVLFTHIQAIVVIFVVVVKYYFVFALNA